MKSRRFQRGVCALVLAALVAATSTPAFAFDGAVVRSLLLPGSGQAEKGNYARAAMFASAAIISGAGLLASQLQYNRAVETYDDAKRVYLHYPTTTTAQNQVVSQSEIDATYDAMQAAFDQADSRVVWRNAFLTAFIATYALNVVDVIMSKRKTGEIDSPATTGMSVEMRGTDVMLVKSFSF